MENKKTIEDIRKEIQGLEEQEFQIKYGLTKEGYNRLKSEIVFEIRHQQIKDRMYEYNSHRITTSSWKVDRMDEAIHNLKCKIKDLQAINTFVCGSLIALGIGVVIAIAL